MGSLGAEHLKGKPDVERCRDWTILRQGAIGDGLAMEQIERLIDAFNARAKPNYSTWKLNVLMDLAQCDGPRVVAFLATVVTDTEEPKDVRLDALRRLREACHAPGERVQMAEASLQILSRQSPIGLRLHAALVLGDVVDVRDVLKAVAALAQDADEPIELRYTAFTSLQRAGPMPECRMHLQILSEDETLGPSARAVIRAWGPN
jgi:hypothetical protein